jgi:uncharacterized protein
MSASKSLRLQKKLRVGEFQQFGFAVDFVLASDLPLDQSNLFWDAFIADAIEANQLSFGGSERGFVVPEGRVSATQAHRQAIQSWLQARPEVTSVAVGPLVDAWRTDGS